MHRDDDPQLWDLLDKAAAPQASPFFARDVVREIRAQKSARSPLLAWLNLRWLIPAAGVAAVLIAGILAIHQSPMTTSSSAIIAKADLDDDVAADIDDLVGSDDEADDDDATAIR